MEYEELEELGFLEVQAAKGAFLAKLQQDRRYTRYQPGSPWYMSPETVLACALAEVWRQGRKYQRDRDNAQLLALMEQGKRDERPSTPSIGLHN